MQINLYSVVNIRRLIGVYVMIGNYMSEYIDPLYIFVYY